MMATNVTLRELSLCVGLVLAHSIILHVVVLIKTRLRKEVPVFRRLRPRNNRSNQESFASLPEDLLVVLLFGIICLFAILLYVPGLRILMYVFSACKMLSVFAKQVLNKSRLAETLNWVCWMMTLICVSRCLIALAY